MQKIILQLFSVIIVIMILDSCKTNDSNPIQSDPIKKDSIVVIDTVAVVDTTIVDDDVRKSIVLYWFNTISPPTDSIYIAVAIPDTGYHFRFTGPSDSLMSSLRSARPHFYAYQENHPMKKTIIILYPLNRIGKNKVEMGSEILFKINEGMGMIVYLHRNTNTWLVDSIKYTWHS